MSAGRYMHGIYAYPHPGGMFRLVAYSGSTYHMKDRIRAAGGTWNGHAWIVPESAVSSLNVKRMVLVEHDGYCHEPAGQELVEESELAAGETRSGFCGRCDSLTGGYVVRPVKA